MKQAEQNKAKITMEVDTGVQSLVLLLYTLWWFSGIAMAQGIGWKIAACLPPVGMVIAVERVISVTAPALLKN